MSGSCGWMARLQTSPPQMGSELQAGPTVPEVVIGDALTAGIAGGGACAKPGAASKAATSSATSNGLRIDSRLLIPLSNDLRQNGDGDFARAVAAEGQPDRRMQLDAAQGRQIQISCRQLFAHPGDLAPAAHEPQIA